MNGNNEFVQKIKCCYVRDNYVQIMVGYKGDSITILDTSGEIYHEMEGSNYFINKQLSNQKDKTIPYFNISKYKDKELTYVNMSFEYNKPYIVICDNHIEERYVVKKDNEALLITTILGSYIENVVSCSNEDVKKLIKENNNNIYDLYGHKKVYSDIIMTEDYILKNYKKILIDELNDVKRVLEWSPFQVNYEEVMHLTERGLNKLTIDDIPSPNLILMKNAIIVKFNKNDIIIKKVNLALKDHNKYTLELYNYPVKNYSSETIKEIFNTNLIEMPEPKIRKKSLLK